MANINCEKCNKLMESVHHATKYCTECKGNVIKTNQTNHYNRNKEIKKEKNETTLKENIFNVVKESFHLTGKGFNLVSDIKCKAYTQFLEKKWVVILKEYDLFDKLLDYIVDSYKDFYKETNRVNLHEFAKWNKYCSYDLLMDVGIDLIKNKASIQKLRYTEKDLINNFKEICNKVGNPPIYIEFDEYSKIPLNTYVAKYKLKGKVYNQLMKIMLDETQYEIYLDRYKVHKSNVGRETGILSATYTDEDYENEFHRVFNHCLTEFGDNPSRRLFESLSIYDLSTYRRKYNKSWLELCEMYGYKVERNHKTEKMVLNAIKSVVSADYVPQKTWKWLIGVGGKNMFCDGYFPDFNLVVEFDGVQHRKPVEAFGGIEKFIRLKENDKLKEKLLKENGIKIIRIKSNDKWHDKNFIKNILLENSISAS